MNTYAIQLHTFQSKYIALYFNVLPLNSEFSPLIVNPNQVFILRVGQAMR